MLYISDRGRHILLVYLSREINKTAISHRERALRPCLFWERMARRDQKGVGLPWVQSSGNYSLTWKRRQLIRSGKLSVLHKFLSLSLTSLISALCNMLKCDTSWHSKPRPNIRLNLSKRSQKYRTCCTESIQNLSMYIYKCQIERSVYL